MVLKTGVIFCVGILISSVAMRWPKEKDLQLAFWETMSEDFKGILMVLIFAAWITYLQS